MCHKRSTPPVNRFRRERSATHAWLFSAMPPTKLMKVWKHPCICSIAVKSVLEIVLRRKLSKMYGSIGGGGLKELKHPFKLLVIVVIV